MTQLSFTGRTKSVLPPVIQSKPARKAHPLRTLPVPSRYCSPITGGPVDAYSAFRLWGQSSGTASSAADGRIYTKRLLSWHTVQRATLSRHRFLLSFFQNSINQRESQPANFQNIPPPFQQFSTRPRALSSPQDRPEIRRKPLWDSFLPPKPYSRERYSSYGLRTTASR